MIFTKEQFENEVLKWENRLVKSCKLCNGLGSTPNLNNNTYKTCDCMKKVMLYSNLSLFGIPRKYLNWDWNQCEDNDFIEICKSYADNFVEKYYNGLGLYLFGGQGRGKSTMEALIAKDVAIKINPDTNRNFKVAFIIYEELIQLSHQSRQDRNAKYKLDYLINNPDLLIIDNVGSETGMGSDTKHNVRLLELILRKRDNNSTPTIVSSNFSPEELDKNYSDTVKDFIIQNCEIVCVDGSNLRRKQESPVHDLFKEVF